MLYYLATMNQQTEVLPDDLRLEVDKTLEDWRVNNKVRRLWEGDAELWTNNEEGKWLGWLNITSQQLTTIEHLESIAEDVKKAGFSHALLLGMGGSSLCPEVL